MAQSKPNIVMMVCHDLGAHIGPYGRAVERCENLMRLSGQSMRFDRHFVTSPGCSPSRASLMTGRYPHNNGQLGLSHLGWELNRDEVLLPAVLREAGYRTAMRGIWHLAEWTLGGFDDLSADVSVRDASPEGPAEEASQRAATWIRRHGRGSAPFYLHLGFWESHRPFCSHLPEVTIEPADLQQVTLPDYLPDTEAARREFVELHRSISEIDAAVRRVLWALEEAKLADDTLVIFTADHGLPFPRAKGTLYDPGVHVALMARWPGRIEPGTSRGALTSNIDLMPTLLEAAGAPIPRRVQGRSFLNVLRGGADRHHDAVFAEKTYHEHYDPIRCIRTDRWKYIRNFAERPKLVLPSDIYNSPTRQSMTDDESLWSHRSPTELYDLQADPRERRNLIDSADHDAVRVELGERLEAWMADTDDPLRRGPVRRPVRA